MSLLDISGQGTGVVFGFENVAISGGEMPDGLTGPEQHLFLGLRALYHQKRAGIITRETAVSEKKKLVHEYGKDAIRMETTQKLISSHNEINNQVWKLVAEYKKAPSLELADKVIRVFDGLEATPCK